LLLTLLQHGVGSSDIHDAMLKHFAAAAAAAAVQGKVKQIVGSTLQDLQG
jgi:hypothetical protein